MTTGKPFSYTAAYETVRTVGSLLAPEGFTWLTEFSREALPTQIVIHLSCMAHYTPHIPFLAQRILAGIGLESVVVGGPEFCCGALHLHFGEEDLGAQSARIALAGFQRARPRNVYSICPDCDEIFPKFGAARMPFSHHNISELLIGHLDALRAAMRPVKRKVIFHFHDVNESRRGDSERIRRLLDAVPGLEIIEAKHARGPGVHCQTLHPMPEADQVRMFDEARRLGAEALVVPYHSCYRQHCRMQISHGVEVQHYFGILAEALGIPFREPFKDLRLLDNIDAALDALAPRLAQYGIDREAARSYLARTVYR